MQDPIVIDYETMPIEQRPNFPPRPVGVALDFPGMAPFYLAWGHSSGNNSTEGEAKEWVWKARRAPNPKLYHNCKFDLAVEVEGWGMPMPHWAEYEDSMFLAFLCDPHARELGLKPLAVDWLNEPPEERDAIVEWVKAHAAELKQSYPEYAQLFGTGKRDAGAWIFATPAELAGPYAVGDVRRTRGLWNHMAPLVWENNMWAAYEREKKLVPIFMENEREGMRVNMERLEVDCHLYERTFDGVEEWLGKALGQPGINIDADQDVAQALIRCGYVPEHAFPRTEPSRKHPSGQLSVSKENLTPDLFVGEAGAQVASVLGYRNRLKTCLTMFMLPWRDQARRNNGHITTNWNQVRGPDNGTRSGRPSCNKHNFLNISKNFNGRDDGFVSPPGVPELPLVRKYVVADEGGKFMHRDFSQQELRLFAHYEQGELNRNYNGNALLDVHEMVGADIIRIAQREIERTKIKTLNFQGIYGGGVPALMRKVRCSLEEARELKKLHKQALPGLETTNNAIKAVVGRGLPIRTWGGRLYFPERPGPDGRSKVYKLLNYLIQGSAADFTKECLIEWYHHPDREARFMVTVYDEINASAPIDVAEKQMALLREVMERPRLSVPMVSDGKWGFSWGELEKCA